MLVTGALDMILNMCRTSTGHESPGHLRPRSQLLDQDSRVADRAGRWISSFSFSKGSKTLTTGSLGLLANSEEMFQVTQNDNGKGMVSGEFVSMTALHKAAPKLVPVPIAWGTYATDSNIHFFLCSFVDMTDDLPDPNKLGAMLADLHQRTVSPNGKYGFSVPTYQGTIPQRVDWQDTWEVFFSNMMRRILDHEWASQGPDEELKQLSETLFEKVIPRLLRPLESGGRKIQPRLVHGDIWDGNTSTDAATDLRWCNVLMNDLSLQGEVRRLGRARIARMIVYILRKCRTKRSVQTLSADEPLY